MAILLFNTAPNCFFMKNWRSDVNASSWVQFMSNTNLGDQLGIGMESDEGDGSAKSKMSAFI